MNKKKSEIMIESMRFSKKESEEIRKKCTELNKQLVMNSYPPMKDSEFIHKILTKTIRYAKISKKGELEIDL